MPESSHEFFTNFFLQKIQAQGKIPFSEYMSDVLYHPERGYYARQIQTLDYYTNVDVHPIFARILAHFIAQKLQLLDPSQDDIFYILEPGCGEGKLGKNILEELKTVFPDLYQKTKYCFLDASPARRLACLKIEENFPGHTQVLENLDQLKGVAANQKGICGVILSNEFFDALPFDRVKMQDGILLQSFLCESLKEERKPAPKEERKFDLKEEKRSGLREEVKDDLNYLKEEWHPAQKEVTDYFDWLQFYPAEGCIAESHIASRSWLQAFSAILRRGSILTIDYGHPAKELFAPIRPEGTALCHYRHQTNRNFWDKMGDQDLTAHVNFTTLQKEGTALGLIAHPLQTQTQFLVEHGTEVIQKTLQAVEQADPKTRLKTVAAIQSLIHPEGMGTTFRVLVQEKG